MQPSAKEHDMCPRIELWIGSQDLISSVDVGVFQLGTWDDVLKDAFNKSGLFSKRGSRNFHHRVLKIDDLKYKNITNIIIEEMGKVWEFV